MRACALPAPMFVCILAAAGVQRICICASALALAATTGHQRVCLGAFAAAHALTLSSTQTSLPSAGTLHAGSASRTRTCPAFLESACLVACLVLAMVPRACWGSALHVQAWV